MKRRRDRARIAGPGWVGTVLLLASLLGVAGQHPARAQSPEETKRINEWFEKNKPKPWNPPKIGEFQKPGDIQKPGQIQTITERCRQRLVLGSDVLFEFDKATLNGEAETALAALGPMIREAGSRPAVVEGHTDAIGSPEYNRRLSERRAGAVRDWLASKGTLPASTPIKGYGKQKPIAPNTKPDGSDDPEGRQKNRRVEVVLNTCG